MATISFDRNIVITDPEAVKKLTHSLNTHSECKSTFSRTGYNAVKSENLKLFKRLFKKNK